MILPVHKLPFILLFSVLIGKPCVSLRNMLPISDPSSRSNDLTRKSIGSYPSGLPRLYSAADDTSNEGGNLIKLPILQIIKNNEITGEFVCGNDLPGSVDKFMATLTSLEKQVNADSLIKSGQYGVRNIYSEEQLEEEIKTTIDSYIILKMFRAGCKKCALLDPVIDDLSRDPLYSKFIFIQADVAYVEKYTADMKDRLLGIRGGNSENVIENCFNCQNTGFVKCTECDGNGYIQKGGIAAFCSACTGYKKTRCSSCGGKCFKCS